MKNILCYGDSNTYGYDARTGLRFDRETRYTSVMQRILGDGYYVIEEGLGGRTACVDDPFFEGRNGLTYLYPCLASHAPVDLVLIMLGTNDVKPRYHLSAFCIGLGIRRLIEVIRDPYVYYEGARIPKILIVSPVPVIRPETGSLCEGFDYMSVVVSSELAKELQVVADKYGCSFFDAADAAEVDEADGVHLTKSSHDSLGKALAKKVLSVLS